jgi:hypothetical protein
MGVMIKMATTRVLHFIANAKCGRLTRRHILFLNLLILLPHSAYACLEESNQLQSIFLIVFVFFIAFALSWSVVLLAIRLLKLKIRKRFSGLFLFVCMTSVFFYSDLYSKLLEKSSELNCVNDTQTEQRIDIYLPQIGKVTVGFNEIQDEIQSDIQLYSGEYTGVEETGGDQGHDHIIVIRVENGIPKATYWWKSWNDNPSLAADPVEMQNVKIEGNQFSGIQTIYGTGGEINARFVKIPSQEINALITSENIVWVKGDN